ncbi:MAG: hypothetical protein JWM41_1175 [Gemmatimonadetes bacterium]|nr:hypothetical protein [Gemmatimonadota bacterium]
MIDAPPSRIGSAAALAAVVVLPVAISSIDTLPAGVVFDDGMYVVLAKSLATGHGYSWLHLPGTPAATHFPPGYPALLSLIWRLFPVFPGNVLAFKGLNACLLTAVAVGIVFFAYRRLNLPAFGACALAIAGCLSVPTLVLSTLVMSEMLFLALLIPSLLLAERVADGEENAITVIALGALAGALILVRTHGVAFSLAVAVALLLRRRRRALAAFVPTALAVVAPWQVWKVLHRDAVPLVMRGAYESYGGWLARGVQSGGLALGARTVERTGLELLGTIMSMSTAGLPSATRWAVTLLVVGVLCAGLVRLRRTALVTALFLVAYVGIVLLWPFTPARFIWGIWPLIVMLAVLGALELRDWRPASSGSRITRAVVAVGIAASLAGYSVYTFRGYRGHWWSSIPRQTATAVRPLIIWTTQNTRPDAVIASNSELLLYLYTGRTSVPATSFSVDDYFAPQSSAARGDALRSILRSYRVDAVAIVANDSLTSAARSMAGLHPPELVLRDSISNGLIFTSMIR